MSRILVTGGAGMIGSNLVKRLVSAGHDTFVIDNLWRGKLTYLNDDSGRPVIDLATHFFNHDLAVAGTFEHLFEGVDYVFHLADVVAGIDYVFKHQGSLFRQNLLINSNVVAAARVARPKGFIYFGPRFRWRCGCPVSFSTCCLKRLFPRAKPVFSESRMSVMTCADICWEKNPR